MIEAQIARERAALHTRLDFLDAEAIYRAKNQQLATPYGCQHYAISRLCRFDRRAIDRKCDGCPRTTDQAYLTQAGLWVPGVSHQDAP